jgi:ribosome-associated toxin RatA of RatAB toxin-antitoxin module
MPTIERSIIINADRAALFELTQDYVRRLRWDCFLKEARLLDGATKATVGVRAWCVAWHGLGMETEYVTVSPPAVAAVKMTRGPAVLRMFAGSWRFAEDGPSATYVTFRYHFKARPRWLAWLIEAVLGVLFGRDARLRLDALKRAAESVVC